MFLLRYLNVLRVKAHPVNCSTMADTLIIYQKVYIFKAFSLPFTFIGFNGFNETPQYFSVSSPISMFTPASLVADSNLAAVFTASPIAE